MIISQYFSLFLEIKDIFLVELTIECFHENPYDFIKELFLILKNEFSYFEFLFFSKK